MARLRVTPTAAVPFGALRPYSGERSAPGAGAILEAFKPGTEPPAAEPPPVADWGPTDVPAQKAYAPPGPIYFR